MKELCAEPVHLGGEQEAAVTEIHKASRGGLAVDAERCSRDKRLYGCEGEGLSLDGVITVVFQKGGGVGVIDTHFDKLFAEIGKREAVCRLPLLPLIKDGCFMLHNACVSLLCLRAFFRYAAVFDEAVNVGHERDKARYWQYIV